MIIFDMHLDTLYRLVKEDLVFDNQKTMFRYNNSGVMDFVTLACFLNIKKDKVTIVDKMITKFDNLAKEGIITKVLNKADLKKPGLKAMLSLEEGAILEGNLAKLDEYYKKGIRLITILWNYPNQIGHPNIVEKNEIEYDKGLTQFGKEVVKKMNDLGMIIDISHLGDKGAKEVIQLSNKPVMASHSNVRSIVDNVRNLSDELIKLLILKDGFIGINFNKSFLTNKKEASFLDVLSHINYIIKLGGINNVGFGSDFDGISTQESKLKDVSCYYDIINMLKQTGYSDLEIEKITYLNAKRVIEANLK